MAQGVPRCRNRCSRRCAAPQGCRELPRPGWSAIDHCRPPSTARGPGGLVLRVHLQLEPAQSLPCVMPSIMRTYAPFSAEPVHVAPQPALHSSSLSPASHFLARRHWLPARPSCSAQAPWLAVDHGSSGLSREKRGCALLCAAQLARLPRGRVCPCQQTAPPAQANRGSPCHGRIIPSFPHGVRAQP